MLFLTMVRKIVCVAGAALAPNTFVNVMPQYRPEGLASRFPTIARPLRGSEFHDAVAIAREEGLMRMARVDL